MIKSSNTTAAISSQVKIKSATIGDESVNSVDARELHEFLEVKTAFTDWIKKRIEDYCFSSNSDYLKISSRNYTGIGKAPIDYIISIDMAKELSMVERNEKGKQARKYFIECERKAKSLPIPSDKKEQLDIGYIALGHLKNHLKMSDVSYLGCAKKLHSEIGVSTAMLPEYVEKVRVTFSATDLLKKNECGIGVRAFNKLLLGNGIMEVKTRTGSRGKAKTYNSITDKGLEYGQNDASPSNPRETQPHWYEDTFMDLFYKVAAVG